MDKFEYHSIIKFFVLDGLTPKEIHPTLKKVYGDSAPSVSTVEKWAAEFKHGRTSLEDDPHEGRPKTGTTPETIKKVHDIVLGNRRVKVSEIVQAVGISKERVRNILHEELGMRYAKALRKMGAAIAECRSKTNAKMNFAAMFGPIQQGSERFYAVICHHG